MSTGLRRPVYKLLSILHKLGIEEASSDNVCEYRGFSKVDGVPPFVARVQAKMAGRWQWDKDLA